MCHSQRIDELLVIFTQLTHHFDSGDELIIVVFESLVSRNLADRVNSRAANLARAFGNVECPSLALIVPLGGRSLLLIPELDTQMLPNALLRTRIRHHAAIHDFTELEHGIPIRYCQRELHMLLDQ